MVSANRIGPPHFKEHVPDVPMASWRTVARPAAVFLMTSRPLCTGVVQQTLPDILPGGVQAVEPDGIDLLYLDGPVAAPAAHSEKMLGNFGKLQRDH
jgi:hypothetical protein